MSTVTVVGKVYQDGVLVADSGAVVPVPPTPTPTPIPPVPTPTPPGTCPPPPGNMLTGVFDSQGLVTKINMPSGQVACYTLPDDPYLSRLSGTMAIPQTTAIPAGTLLEICISKCPGVIDKNAGGNYFATKQTDYNEVTWFFKLAGQWTLEMVKARGYAWAPKAEGPWYFNARYTYSGSPPWGNYASFGYQWGNGPY